MTQEEYRDMLREQLPYVSQAVCKGDRRDIDRIKAEAEARYGFRPTSIRAQIADRISHEPLSIARQILRGRVQRQEISFKYNPGNGAKRQPKGIAEQMEELDKTIAQVARHLARRTGKQEFSEMADEMETEIVEEMDSADEETVEEIREIVEETKTREQEIAQELLDWIQKTWRPFTKRHAADGKPMEDVGMRPALSGAAQLRQGISVDAIKYALTMEYSAEARRELGVKDFDAKTFKPQPFDSSKLRVPAGVKLDTQHKVLPLAMANALAGVPIYLYGPKGTGKTELAKALTAKLAEVLDRPMEFGFVSMSPGTSPAAFFGRPKIGGDGEVVKSFFEKILKNGGGYLFDEIDNADPRLLAVLNATLANGHFANDLTGEIVDKSEHFVPIAAANTLGTGGEKGYMRGRLDEATLDRFKPGRIRVDLDEELETALYWRKITG